MPFSSYDVLFGHSAECFLGLIVFAPCLQSLTCQTLLMHLHSTYIEKYKISGKIFQYKHTFRKLVTIDIYIYMLTLAAPYTLWSVDVMIELNHLDQI